MVLPNLAFPYHCQSLPRAEKLKVVEILLFILISQPLVWLAKISVGKTQKGLSIKDVDMWLDN